MKKARLLPSPALMSLIIFVVAFSLCAAPAPSALAKVYIDITSPFSTKLPIAIQDFAEDLGPEISDMVRDDLVFTGLFELIDKAAYLEKPSQPFDPRQWTPLGVETVLKGRVVHGEQLTVTASLFDVIEGKEIFRKEYKSKRELVRPLAHALANDIYQALTGQEGMFRTKIAFVGRDTKEKRIYFMDWDGHRVIKTGMKGDIVLSPHYSSDGSKLVYSAAKQRQWGIYLLDFGSMTEKKVFSSQGTHMAGDFFPEGNAFTFSSTRHGTPDIFIYSLESGNTTRITSSQGIEVSPAVSPDSRSIAFVSDRGGSPQIYIINRDGSNLRRVTFEGSYNTSPSWSPKGDKLVFSGRRGSNQIFIVNPDGTGLVQLTFEGNNEDPSFSPDGRYIAFTSDRQGTKGIYIMRSDGEAQTRISPANISTSGPRWSPGE
jgi:TolB protein